MVQRLYWGLDLGETSGFLTTYALVADHCDQIANKEVERSVYMCIIGVCNGEDIDIW